MLLFTTKELDKNAFYKFRVDRTSKEPLLFLIVDGVEHQYFYGEGVDMAVRTTQGLVQTHMDIDVTNEYEFDYGFKNMYFHFTGIYPDIEMELFPASELDSKYTVSLKQHV